MKESYIAAKERWARKMAGQQKPAPRSVDRLPPDAIDLPFAVFHVPPPPDFWKDGGPGAAGIWDGRRKDIEPVSLDAARVPAARTPGVQGVGVGEAVGA